MSDDAPERDYDVGYGKPPAATRFRLGQSGNPSGRQKGCKNGKALLRKELKVLVSLTENGKPYKLPKHALIIKQAINKAVKGDIKDYLALVKYFGLEEADATTGDADALLESEEDAQTYESFLNRVKGGGS